MDRLNIILPVLFIAWTLISIPIVYRFLRNSRECMRAVVAALRSADAFEPS